MYSAIDLLYNLEKIILPLSQFLHLLGGSAESHTSKYLFLVDVHKLLQRDVFKNKSDSIAFCNLDDMRKVTRAGGGAY